MMGLERLIAVWSTGEEIQGLPALEAPAGFSTASGVWAAHQTHKSHQLPPSCKDTLFLPMVNYLHSVDRGWSYSRRSWDVPSPSESQVVQPDTGWVSPGGGFPESWNSHLDWATWRCVSAASPWWPWRDGSHTDWRTWTGSSGSGQAEWLWGGSPWFHIALSTTPGGWLHFLQQSWEELRTGVGHGDLTQIQGL